MIGSVAGAAGSAAGGSGGLSPESVAGAKALSPSSPFGRPSGARLFSALVQSPKKSKLVSAREEEEEEESEEETKADDEEERRPAMDGSAPRYDSCTFGSSSSQFSNPPPSITQSISELNISSGDISRTLITFHLYLENCTFLRGLLLSVEKRGLRKLL